MKSMFNIENKKSTLECKMFLDEDNDGVTLSRFEQVKYPRILKLRDIQEGFFWRPVEIDLTKDQRDFKSLSEHEQRTFTLNLKFQTLLDSTQSRAASQLFAASTTLPEIEHFCHAWGFTESIHSFSYTWIVRNIYVDSSEIFDSIMIDQNILNRASEINKYYNIIFHGKYWLFSINSFKRMCIDLGIFCYVSFP